MGARLKKETYDWSGSSRILEKNAQYISHALKNENTKIEWCVNNLESNAASSEAPEELDIIRHSMEHLKNFITRTQIYSNEITLNPERC